MNKILEKIGGILPKKLGLYIITLQLAVFILDVVSSFARANPFSFNLMFSKDLILQGQFWRLITFVFIDTIGDKSIISLIMGLFSLYVSYYIYNYLNALIGYRRINGYLVINYILLVIFGFIFGFTAFTSTFDAFFIPLILTSLFYDRTNFDVTNIIFLVLIAYIIFSDISGRPFYIISFVLALIMFKDPIIGIFRRKSSRSFSKTTSKKLFQDKKEAPRHRCVVCGKTDISHPDMTFRYCSKCQGSYEYCEEHIHNHEHKTNVIEFKPKNNQ